MYFKIFICLVTLGGGLSLALGEKKPGGDQESGKRPSIFGTIVPEEERPVLAKEENYCVSQLREVDPATGKPRTDAVFQMFRRAYESLMKQPITDDEIRAFWADPNGPPEDDATLIRKKFPDQFYFCLSQDRIRSEAIEHLKMWKVDAGGIERFMRAFETEGKHRFTLQGEKSVDIDLIRKDDSVDLAMKMNRGYNFGDGPSTFQGFNVLRLNEDVFRTALAGSSVRDVFGTYRIRPREEYTALVEKRIDAFRRGLVSASMSNRGGMSAANEGLFPGDQVAPKELAPLETLLKNDWRSGDKIEQSNVHDYGEKSLLGTSAIYGNVVFDESSVHVAFHSFVDNSRGGDILDIAGAIGANSLQHIGSHRVILNDININELAVAYAFVRKYMTVNGKNLILNNVPANELNLPPNSVAATFMGYLVKYFRGEDLDRLFKKAFEFTKPGGRLFIVELKQNNGFYTSQGCIPSQSAAKNKLWPNECGYKQHIARADVFYRGGSRLTEEVEMPYFLNNVSLDDIKNALVRAGFRIISSSEEPDRKRRSNFGWIAEKPSKQN